MSRISGYGGGYGHGPGQPRQRAEAFRARHRVGERLRGRILRHEPGGLTLVEVDGQELLARLEVPAEPGDTLLFLVRALLPEIHLQALQGEAAGSDPAGLLQQFRTARQAFESRAARHLSALPLALPPSCDTPPAFRALLALDGQLAELHAQAQALLAQLDAELAGPRGRRALYVPWCVPGLARCEALLALPRGGGEYFELAASGHLERYGEVELRLVGREASHHLRLWLERPEREQELAGLVREGLRGLGSGVEMSLGRLGAHVPGGVFTELLGEAASVSGGLNARV